MSSLADVVGTDTPHSVAMRSMHITDDRSLAAYINQRFGVRWSVKTIAKMRRDGACPKGNGFANRRAMAQRDAPADAGGNGWQTKAREGSDKLRDAILAYLARRA